MTQRRNPGGDTPRVAGSSFVDSSALLIGNVQVGEHVFIGPGAVIRADEEGSLIKIGDGCNIQDRVVIHALEGSVVDIGRGVSLAHGCIIHGPCRIGDGSFVGFSSVVFRAELKEEVVVKHLAVVEGVEVGPGRVVESLCRVSDEAGVEGLAKVGTETLRFTRRVAAVNRALLEGYRKLQEKGG